MSQCYGEKLKSIVGELQIVEIKTKIDKGGTLLDKVEAIKSLYSQRESFILIGLTGRTGSGCTTVSNILSKESMEELDLRSYKTRDYNSADERKYSVIYRYMKEGDKWKKFEVIEASSIIFSFILEGTYGTLFDFIDSLGKKGEIKDKDTLKEKIMKALNENYDNNKTVNEYRDEIIDEKIEKIFNNKDGETNLEIETLEKDKNLKETVSYCIEVCKEKKKAFQEIVRYQLFEEKEDKESISKDIRIYNLYSYFMQEVGNNIRSSGKYNDATEVAGKEITVANRINILVKAINQLEKMKDGDNHKTRICIDALRNSVEIQYFRDRYRAFYVFAVNTENEHRQNRLELNKKELQSLDKIEYPHSNSVFYHQNIQACLEISDVYLYNPNVLNHKYYDLSEQILKYIALIIQPGLITPSHLERCMQLAFNAKYNSGCLSRQVGAVVTGNDFSVRSVGWNDIPKGQVACNLRCVEDYCMNKDEETFSEYELSNNLFDEVMYTINEELEKDDIKKKKNGKCYAYCFKDVYNALTNQKNQVYTRALHAEENAFLQISKYGGAHIQGGKLFTTASPCELCSKKAYQLGIEEIYYIDPYPGISKSHILTFGTKGNPKMILFQGAIGNAYISLYAPRMPYKDEMELVTGISTKNMARKEREEHKENK